MDLSLSLSIYIYTLIHTSSKLPSMVDLDRTGLNGISMQCKTCLIEQAAKSLTITRENRLMEMESGLKVFPQNKKSCSSTKFIICLSALSLLILFHIQSSTFSSPSSASWVFFQQLQEGVAGSTHRFKDIETLTAKLRDSVTFLPLKDLRFSTTASTGNTWFMSSLNDTYDEDEAEHLYFPSLASKGRLLCLKGRNIRDGTKNSYALAWPESLPESATLLEGLTFVSDTYYNHDNLWHGLCAMTPFVGWSMKNGCSKPARWVLFHWGELRTWMGPWLEHLMRANFGPVGVEKFGNGDGGPYCFDKSVVMRHDMGRMGKEKKLKAFDLLRCKARKACGLNPAGRGNKEVTEWGVPIIRLTLLMRRGSRAFKNPSAVTDIFAKECAKVEGCVLNVARSEDLSFCDQVRLMSNTDIVASPHGAQLTNMLFMDRDSSVMEFFPKGWLEHPGPGQYTHHWMANQSGMKHQGAWWDPVGDDDCPTPKLDPECFSVYKDGPIGHNQTYFAEWARKVLHQVRVSKLEQASKNNAVADQQVSSSACVC